MILTADGSVVGGGRGDAPAPPARAPTNACIAGVLERIADLLQVREANAFRVGAYRSAARRMRRLERPATSILREEGREGLEDLPDIGRAIAALIDELAETGRLRLLERLEGGASSEDAFTAVPGIGEVLAGRAHRELGIETLEELELAAHDGRLAEVEGFGERRVRDVRDAVAAILGRSPRRRAGRRLRAPPAGGRPGAPRRPRSPEGAGDRGLDRGGTDRHTRSRGGGKGSGGTPPGDPPVAEILSVDAEYRRRAEAGELRELAPRRFNPEGVAWLPILHIERDGRSFTALYSNTARAHRLGRTRDWVVVSWDRNGGGGRATVVSEYRGVLEGLRVVRGREEECLAHYRGEGGIWKRESAALG